jgi:putative ABC transport system ATP-binding protein
VFQQARLLPFLSIEENLRLVGRNSGIRRQVLSRRIDRLLDELSLADVRNRSPDETSGGERQRASIARAILHRPAIVLADEPTASLDWPTGGRVMELLIQQAREEKALLIIVTHDPRAAALAHRSICIDSGRVVDV